MNKNSTEILKTHLKPLYAKLIECVSDFELEKAFFCMQWGKNFPLKTNHGILFVGRATNGWDSWTNDDITVDSVFDCIFNKFDQMQWVEDMEGDARYNTNKSAFWRVTKQITKHYHPTNWTSYIAWSNICKVAPGKEGNPNNALYEAQINVCHQIMQAEIEVLSPKIVLFLTGKNWALSTLRYLNHNEPTKSIKKFTWGDYECKAYEIDNVFYLLTEHPQGKPETAHVQCIIDLLKALGCEDSI